MPRSSDRRRIIRDGTLDKWIAGLERFDQPTERDEERWRLVTNLFYINTQFKTHIITGELIKSGRHATERTAGRIVGSVTYGGTEKVDYAVYEFRRGGQHDALLLGFKETHAAYQKALRDIMMEHVKSWK